MNIKKLRAIIATTDFSKLPYKLSLSLQEWDSIDGRHIGITLIGGDSALVMPELGCLIHENSTLLDVRKTIAALVRQIILAQIEVDLTFDGEPLPAEYEP